MKLTRVQLRRLVESTVNEAGLNKTSEDELFRICVEETGGDYSDDDELFKNVVNRVKAEGSRALKQVPTDVVQRFLKTYLRDMEESGDWD